jgi:ssRNA-specific RNase YbeY (16S rRNA maturation enzyme)
MLLQMSCPFHLKKSTQKQETGTWGISSFLIHVRYLRRGQPDTVESELQLLVVHGVLHLAWL